MRRGGVTITTETETEIHPNMKHFKNALALLMVWVVVGCSAGGNVEVSTYEGMSEQEVEQTKQMEQQILDQQRAMMDAQLQQMRKLQEQANGPAAPPAQP